MFRDPLNTPSCEALHRHHPSYPCYCVHIPRPIQQYHRPHIPDGSTRFLFTLGTVAAAASVKTGQKRQRRLARVAVRTAATNARVFISACEARSSCEFSSHTRTHIHTRFRAFVWCPSVCGRVRVCERCFCFGRGGACWSFSGGAALE